VRERKKKEKQQQAANSPTKLRQFNTHFSFRFMSGKEEGKTISI